MKKNTPQANMQTASQTVRQTVFMTEPQDASLPASQTVSKETPQKKKKKKKISVVSIVRIGVQILFFVWLPSLYISAFAGVQELFTSVVTGTFSLSAIWQDLLPFVAIVPITIFAGRFFCGWMCAFGSLTDWIYRVFSRWTKNKILIPKNADRALKYIKYIVLAALLLLGWFAGSLSLSAMSPWDAFGMLFTVGAAPAFSVVFQSLLPGLALLIFVLLASAFVERFFCRYLCPMGAFFALTSIGRTVKINKPREKCGKCQICTKNCAMGIPLSDMDIVKSGECIGCMKCVEGCPRKNVSVQSMRIPVQAIAVSAVIVVLITGTFLFATHITDFAATPLDAAATGTIATGSSGSATDASSAGSSAAGTTTDAGSTGSGATTSATAGASSGTSSGTAAGTSAGTATGTSGKTPASAPATASTTSPAPTTAATAAATTTVAGLYKDGTYQGSGSGFRGTTTVEVTVAGGKVTGVSVVSFKDDAPYFNKAFSTISANVLSTQNAAVDVVSHATYSSNGIIGAIKDALTKAAV